jgi:hypothetical protein
MKVPPSRPQQQALARVTNQEFFRLTSEPFSHYWTRFKTFSVNPDRRSSHSKDICHNSSAGESNRRSNKENHQQAEELG